MTIELGAMCVCGHPGIAHRLVPGSRKVRTEQPNGLTIEIQVWGWMLAECAGDAGGGCAAHCPCFVRGGRAPEPVRPLLPPAPTSFPPGLIPYLSPEQKAAIIPPPAPKLKTQTYDLNNLDTIRLAAKALPRSLRLQEELLRCVRAELAHFSPRKGIELEHGRELEKRALVYRTAKRSKLWRPTMVGIMAGRMLCTSPDDLTGPLPEGVPPPCPEPSPEPATPVERRARPQSRSTRLPETTRTLRAARPRGSSSGSKR